MKYLKHSFFAASAAALMVVSGCASMMGGSGRGVEMSASPLVPAAAGEVAVNRTDNGNTEVNLNVEHMAEPQRIRPGASTYMVWVQPPGESQKAQPLGALRVDESRKGNLSTITPMKNFEVFVTAEESAQSMSPSGERLLWTVVAQ